MAGYSDRDAVIVDAVRTPLGKGKPTGALARVHPVDLLATPCRALAERTDLDPGLLDDVIVGTVSQVGEQAFNVGRGRAGRRLPRAGAGHHGRPPVRFVAAGDLLRRPGRAVAGAYDLVIAGGVESMSRVPMGSPPPARATSTGALAERYPEGLVQPGRGRRADRRQVGRDRAPSSTSSACAPGARRAAPPTGAPSATRSCASRWSTTARGTW